MYAIGRKPELSALAPLAAVNGLFLCILMKIDLVGLVGLVIALIPFSKAIGGVEIGIVTFHLYTVAIVVLGLIAIPRMIHAFMRHNVSATDIWLLLLAVNYLISTLAAENIVEAGYLAFHAIFIPILTYIVIKYLVRSEREWEEICVLFLSGVTIFSCFVIGEFFVTQSRVAVLGVQYISISTLTVIPLFALVSLGLWRRWYWFIAYILIFGAFAVTLSRMYIVILLVSPLIHIAVKRGAAANVLGMFLAFSLALTLLLAAAPEIVKHKEYVKEQEKSLERVINIEYWKRSLFMRAQSFKQGLEHFMDSPLIGIGLYKGEKMVTQHNFNVEWLEYGGLLGYFLYAGVLISHFRRAGSIAPSEAYVATNLTLVILVLANSATNGLMHGIMPVIMMLLMGLTEARLGWQRTDPRPEPLEPRELVMNVNVRKTN